MWRSLCTMLRRKNEDVTGEELEGEVSPLRGRLRRFWIPDDARFWVGNLEMSIRTPHRTLRSAVLVRTSARRGVPLVPVTVGERESKVIAPNKRGDATMFTEPEGFIHG